MSIKIIALDLDGTTLSSDRKLGKYTGDAIRDAISTGIEVIICTGRSINAVPEQITSIEGLRYVISSNGASITDIKAGKKVYRKFLDMEAVQYLMRLSRTDDLMLEVFVENQAYMDASLYRDIYENGYPYRNRDYVINTRKPIENILKFTEEHIDEIENITVFFDDLDKLEVLKPIIYATPKATVTQSFVNNIEIGGDNTSKGTALEYMTDFLGRDKSEVMCCGDAPNDVPMLQFASIGIAMANAWEEAKKAADYITDDNDSDGVGKAIRKFAFDE